MNLLGRRTDGDWGWPKRSRLLLVPSLGLSAIHAIVAVACLASRSFAIGVLESGVVGVVLLAIFLGLPRVRPAAAPPVDLGAYRSGGAVPAIDPGVSRSFTDVVLTLFVAMHLLACVAAAVVAFGALLLFGLVAFLCSKH